MALKVVRDGRDEGVGEAAVGVFRIIGIEGEALVSEYCEAADVFYRVGRTAQERIASALLDSSDSI